MTKKYSYCLMRLFLLFALFVTVPINSYIYIPIYGLFGELKTLVVADEYNEEIAEVSSKVTAHKKQKGKNIFNLWLVILVYIACLRLLAHIILLPKTDTIVAKKVRMNN